MKARTLILWLVLCTLWMPAAFGQMPATFLAEDVFIQPAQCGPSGCGIGIGTWRSAPPARGSGLPVRPQNEPLAFEGMCQIEGGLGVHVGDGIVVTCFHGGHDTITLDGRTYPAQLLASSPTNEHDVAVLRTAAPFRMKIAIATTEPAIGATVSWQGNSGTVLRYDAGSMRIRGRCRLGDSGSPIWIQEGLVGVLSATRTDGTPEFLGARLSVIRQLVAAARSRIGVPSEQPPANSGRETAPPANGSPDCTAVETKVADIDKRLLVVEGTIRECGKKLVPIADRVESHTQQITALTVQVNNLTQRLDAIKSTPPDYDAIAAEVAKRLPKREVQFLDSHGNVAAKQVVAIGEPIKIPPAWLRTLDKDGVRYSDTVAPLGWPLELKSLFIEAK